MVLGLCTKMLVDGQTGEEQELTQTSRARIEEVISDFAKQAMRTICLAYRDLAPGEEVQETSEQDQDQNQVSGVVTVEELQQTPGAEALASSGIDVYRVETG